MLTNPQHLPNLPLEVQQVLPSLMRLSLEERATLASLLLSPFATETVANMVQTNRVKDDGEPSSKPKRSRLGADVLGVSYVSEDFDEELGEAFWFGKDADADFDA